MEFVMAQSQEEPLRKPPPIWRGRRSPPRRLHVIIGVIVILVILVVAAIGVWTYSNQQKCAGQVFSPGLATFMFGIPVGGRTASGHAFFANISFHVSEPGAECSYQMITSASFGLALTPADELNVTPATIAPCIQGQNFSACNAFGLNDTWYAVLFAPGVGVEAGFPAPPAPQTNGWSAIVSVNQGGEQIAIVASFPLIGSGATLSVYGVHGWPATGDTVL
jgi:hypothetical protein